MKKILAILGGVVLVIVIAVFLLLGSLDSIIKGQIEKVGTELTGVPVTVGSVELSLTDGAGTISGLTIANPPGYSDNPAFSLGTLKLGIDINSLSKANPIVLDNLVIDSMDANLELRTDSSNLSVIAENVSKNTESAEQETTETESGKPLLITIRQLFINDVNIVINDGKSTKQDTLPTIELANVGGEAGATPAGITGAILSKLISEILKEAAAEALMKKANDAVQGATKSLMDSLNKAFE